MITSTVIYNILHFVNLTLEIRNICVFLAPLFSSFTTIVTFLLTRELKDTRAGLIAAAMIAIVPGYISRSVAGSYDNEGKLFNKYYYTVGFFFSSGSFFFFCIREIIVKVIQFLEYDNCGSLFISCTTNTNNHNSHLQV